MTQPLFAWYGDDFTGASDTLALLAQGGLRAILLLGGPTTAQRAAAARALGGDLQAVGIAGTARSLAPAAMEAELAPAASFLAGLGAPVLHYKVCSTFDSAPQTGSIGVAVRTLRRHARNPFVAIVGGQPSLGRYCAFSNLFAAAGRGGAVERIDRHPTMSRHPVTPMHEADLRRHLAAQGLAPVAALHSPLYTQATSVQDAALTRALADAPAAVLLDVADGAHLAPVGRLLWERAQQETLLAVGPSSVAESLLAHWGGAAPASELRLPVARGPVLVFAGSLSPLTARQVEAASSYQCVHIEPGQMMDAQRAAAVALDIVQALRAGRNVLACTASGDADTARAGDVARESARFLRGLVQACAQGGAPLARLGIAGGDTSSHAVRALAPWGLSYLGTLGPGVAVTRMHCDDPALDGLALMLKGGQMGSERVFEELVQGTTA